MAYIFSNDDSSLSYIVGGLATIAVLSKFKFLYRNIDSSLAELAKKKLISRNSEAEEFLRRHPISDLSQAKTELIQACQDSSDILALYRKGKVKVQDVILYYIYAAWAANEKTNCLTEVMFEEALEAAKKLDEHFEETGELYGPLHGLPVSIKDCLSYAGKDSTIGVIKFSFKPKESSSVIVRQLLEAGAIPFVKTNLPQTMMTFECNNPLWGNTDNPKRPGFSPGGSSGGEGALIGAGGPILGIGSDIGGSLRIPAHFSGICALRPSYNRVSSQGDTDYIPASLLVKGVNGPMGRTVDDLINLSSVLMGPCEYDSRMIRIPFDKEEAVKVKRIRFGIARTDGFAHPVPAVTRALEMAKEALLESGHEVVEFEYPPNIIELVRLYSSIVNADGGHHMLETVRGEPLDHNVKPLLLASQMDSTMRSGLLSIARSLFPDKRATALLDSIGERPVKDLMVLEQMRIDAQYDFDTLWKETGIDVLLCPPNAMPAIPRGTFSELAFTASHTLLFNLLDYTAGVLPVTEVDPNKDAYPIDFVKPSGSIFKEDLIESSIYKYYDPEKMEGLPVGVQVVGLPYHEEQVLNAMKAVETALKSADQQVNNIL